MHNLSFSSSYRLYRDLHFERLSNQKDFVITESSKKEKGKPLTRSSHLIMWSPNVRGLSYTFGSGTSPRLQHWVVTERI
jgi:hypothetical protein